MPGKGQKDKIRDRQKGEEMTETSIEKIKQRSEDILERAKALIITDEKGLSMANEAIVGIKGIRREIFDFFRPNIDRLNRAHLEALAQMRKFDGPLEQGEKHVKGQIAGYFAELRRKQAEEAEAARRVEEERKRIEEEKLRAAIEAEEKGKTEEAEKILEEIPEAKPAPVAEMPKMKNVFTRSEPKWRVIDEKKIPRNLLVPNGPEITRLVDLAKGKIEIPGIEIYFVDVVVGRGGR